MSNWGAIYDNMVMGLRDHSLSLARLQEQVASGRRILRASDGPSDAFQIMQLQEQQGSLETYLKNVDQVVGDLENASSVCQELISLVADTRSLLHQAASGTYNQAQRTANGEAIDQLLEQAVWLANSRVVGRFLFGGQATGAQPYVVERKDGRITAVTYTGSSQDLRVPVAAGVEETSRLVGEGIFRTSDRQEPLFLGNTGAGPGLGTSTVQGDVWLIVTHGTTTYGGATGVAAGSQSAAEDTIVGTSHTLTIDADAKTICLDNGPNVSYGGGGDDSNICVTNEDGDVAYVDVTGLDPGLSGTVQVSITSTANLSIDDMATSVEVTAFSSNELVTDSRTGQILYMDAGDMVRVGLEPVRVPGTYDLFEMLITARDLLLNEKNFSTTEQLNLLSEGSINSVAEVLETLTTKSTAVGSRLQAMASLQQNMENAKEGVNMRRSGLQDADIIQVATELARTQAFYEMMLMATNKVLSLSLLDFL